MSALILLDPYGSKRLAIPYIQANSRRGILVNTSISLDLVAFQKYVEWKRRICMDKKEIDGQGKGKHLAPVVYEGARRPLLSRSRSRWCPVTMTWWPTQWPLTLHCWPPWVQTLGSLRRKPPFWFRAWGVDQGIAITAGLVGDDISCMMVIELSEFFYLWHILSCCWFQSQDSFWSDSWCVLFLTLWSSDCQSKWSEMSLR